MFNELSGGSKWTVIVSTQTITILHTIYIILYTVVQRHMLIQFFDFHETVEFIKVNNNIERLSKLNQLRKTRFLAK